MPNANHHTKWHFKQTDAIPPKNAFACTVITNAVFVIIVLANVHRTRGISALNNNNHMEKWWVGKVEGMVSQC